MQPKYTRMSRIHQSLCKIEVMAMEAGHWRRVVNFKDSTKIFDQSIIQPLLNDGMITRNETLYYICLLYTSPSPRDRTRSRMPSSA